MPPETTKPSGSAPPPVNPANSELAAPMSALPDDLWALILERGTRTSRLDHRDLCSLAISCRRLNRLSSDPGLWSTLLSLHLLQSNPSVSSKSPSKSLFRSLFERDKAQKHLLWRRTVLRAESQVLSSKRRVSELKRAVRAENKNFRGFARELANLERARSASVALNVWEPQVIRGRHREIVEQRMVGPQSRISTLKMQLKVCEKQIDMHKRALSAEERRLNEGKEMLARLKYHPLKSFGERTTVGDSSERRKEKKKQSPDLVTLPSCTMQQ